MLRREKAGEGGFGVTLWHDILIPLLPYVMYSSTRSTVLCSETLLPTTILPQQALMDLDKPAKRRRSPSPSSKSSSSSPRSRSSSPSLSPAPKYHRPSPSNLSPTDATTYICVLPPTCSQPSTSSSYPTLAELERHQESFHRWICLTPIRVRAEEAEVQEGCLPERFTKTREGTSWKECEKAFPDERLLNLVCPLGSTLCSSRSPIGRTEADETVASNGDARPYRSGTTSSRRKDR